MDWDQIGSVVDACKKDLCEGVLSGGRPLPTGLVFVERNDERGVVTIHRHAPIQSAADVESLSEAVRQRTPHAQAAGFVTIMPRSVWATLNRESYEPANTPLDYVGVIHVEHLTLGSRTWVVPMENLIVDSERWTLYRHGVYTPLPACIDSRRYGTTRGQA